MDTGESVTLMGFYFVILIKTSFARPPLRRSANAGFARLRFDSPRVYKTNHRKLALPVHCFVVDSKKTTTNTLKITRSRKYVATQNSKKKIKNMPLVDTNNFWQKVTNDLEVLTDILKKEELPP